MTNRLKTFPLLIALLLSMAGATVAPVRGQAVYVPSQTRDLKHTDGARLDTLVDDVRGHYQSRLSNWFRGGISGKKIAILGDSTSDGTGNASTLYSVFLAFYQAGGESLNGVTISDFGSNGCSLSAWLSSMGGTGKNPADLYAAAPDLVVFCFGINDVRLGATNLAQFKALMLTAINGIRANLPNADIILRMPNSLLSQDTGSHYVSPNGSAQTYSYILRDAYRYYGNKWPNVLLWDTQADIYGETADTLANRPLMSDQLHPSGTGYSAVADGLAAIAGYRVPFSSSQAAAARTVSYGTDYTIYSRAVEDTGYYDLVASGKYLDAGTNYLRFHWASGRSSEITIGDLVVEGDQSPWSIPAATGITTYNDGTAEGATQINHTPPVSISAGTVHVYRHRYGGDATIELYARSYGSYPYKWRATVDDGGNGFARIKAFPGELAAGSRSSTVTGDVLVVAGLGAVTSFNSISVFSSTVLQIAKTGTNFAPYIGKTCWIFGTHNYENGTTTRVVGNEPPNTQAN